MAEPTDRDERTDEEHEPGKGGAEEPERRTAGTPLERTPERHLEIEPGVELHAGEDAGQVPRDDEDR